MILENSWVNWVEAEECVYNIPAFFEWDREKDPLACLPRIPVFKVTSGFFAYVETGLNVLPKSLLEETKDVYGESLFALTDGESVLVVATIGYDIAMLKSRLDIRRELLVLQQACSMETRYFAYTPIQQAYSESNWCPSLMIGLTRKERKQKKELLNMLVDVKEESRESLLYYYTELCPAQYEQARNLSKNALHKRLKEAVASGWSCLHVELYQLLFLRMGVNEENTTSDENIPHKLVKG